jgi:hypothetical protein
MQRSPEELRCKRGVAVVGYLPALLVDLEDLSGRVSQHAGY